MAKALFRFLRGELNGFYIQNIHQTLNEYSKDLKGFLTYYKNQQFENGKISDADLYGLGSFAGIFLPRMSRAESITSMRMTESHKENGYEYSERGLLNKDTDTFEFKHCQEDTSELPDINTLATDKLRSSLVGNEQPLGYISSEEEDILDDNGNVRPEKVLSEPPEGVAYSEYYGDIFLYLSQPTRTYENLDPVLYIYLFKALQYVRYNGTSIESLKKVVEATCPNGLVTIGDIVVMPDNKHLKVYYKFNGDIELNLKQLRLSVFKYIVQIKFQQIELEEIAI